MVLGAVLTLIAGQSYVASLGQSSIGMIPGIFVYLLITAVVAVAAGLVCWIALWLIEKVPKTAVLVLVAVFVAILYVPYAIWYWIVAVGVLVGALISVAIHQGIRKPSSILSLAIALGILVATVLWLANPGDDSYLVRPDADITPVIPLDLPSPSAPGPMKYDYLTYGSGTDKRRAEYGPSVAIKTSTVDASGFLPQLDAWKEKERWSYWGFDASRLPLNGRVWYPRGEGPYPLVLVVHGNHPMWEFSDPGYAWLGQHLATHGYMVVSIDENFLNLAVTSDYEQDENIARTLLVFQHLALWKQFNEHPSSRFAGKVDMRNIALVGHSRGGQAVTTAGAFNQLASHPENGNFKFDFNYNIKTIVSIAPVDPYSPSGSLVPLSDVNFLTLYGGHDAQAPGFWGLRPYYDTTFQATNYGCKSAVYFYRGNHALFNTAWGGKDFGPLLGWLVNHKPVMPPDAQRQVGAVFITAFLEATLRGKTAYLDLFRDSRRGRGWLPDDVFVTQFEDSRFRSLADFSEDINLATTTIPGGTIHHENFVVVAENLLKTRTLDSTGQKVVYLGWNRNGNASVSNLIPQYSIRIPANLAQEWNIGSESFLSFFACNSQASPVSLDLSVELEDRSGNRSRIPLSHFLALHPPLVSKLSKGLYDFQAKRDYEQVPQTYELPLSEFTTACPAFDPSQLSIIRFVFDRTESGEILLGRIGIAGR